MSGDHQDQRNDREGGTAGHYIGPMKVLDEARRAVPVVNYALGLVGLAAAAALISGFVGRGQAAAVIMALVFIGGLLLFLFARLSRSKNRHIEKAGIFLLWAVTLFFTCFLVFTVTAFAIGEPKQWAKILGLSEPPPLDIGLPMETVANTLSGGGKDEVGQTIARAFKRDVLELSSKPFPITGERTSTKGIKLEKMHLAFLQGANAQIKLQKFTIPEGAQRLRGASHVVVDKGTSFEATTWAFVQESNHFVPLTPIMVSGETSWQISSDQTKRDLYFLAYYSGTNANLILPNGKGYVGIEVDDLAGTIVSLTLTLGGKLSGLGLDGIYVVSASQPPTLLPVRSDALSAIGDPKSEITRLFGALIEDIRTASMNGQALGKLSDLLTVWREAMSEGHTWKAIELNNVERDVMVLVQGQRTPGS